MSATTTQLLSSGEFCKLRYDTMPVKSASANVSFYTNQWRTRNFFQGGGVQQIQLRTEDRENGDLGAVAP